MSNATIPGDGGLPKLALRSTDGARLELYLHGAQVVSWIPAGESADRLYRSARATFRAGAAIRGGVPVSFPQFAKQGPLANHGFARTSTWELVASGLDAAGRAHAQLRLRDTPATRAEWPHAFELELTASVGGRQLAIELAVANASDAPWSFTAALHTYFRVEAAAETVIRGLEGLAYRDKLSGAEDVVEVERELRIDRALDRVYAGAPELELAEREVGRARSIAIRASGFADTVVWNPGASAAALADVAPGDEARFVCVEAATAHRPVTLAPRERWFGGQTLVAS